MTTLPAHWGERWSVRRWDDTIAIGTYVAYVDALRHIPKQYGFRFEDEVDIEWVTADQLTQCQLSLF